MLLQALSLAFLAMALAEDHWNYEHQDYWARYSAKCAGKRQSPINVMSVCSGPTTTKLDEQLWLEQSGYVRKIAADHFQLANNGHSAQLTLKLSDAVNKWAPKIKGSGVEDNEYQFNQLHFHWNKNDDIDGSEHAIDGQRYALEMQ